MTSKIFLVFLLFIVIGNYPIPLAAQKKDNSYKDMPAEILRYVNLHRSEKGLKPLVLNDVISRGAEDHSKNMASGKIPFSHLNLDERVAKINKQLKQHATAWAENVASGRNTAKGVVDMWLKSPGHRENIEGNYNMTGIGIAKSADGSMYFTQIFIYKSR